MGNCNGNCSGCSGCGGCAGTLELTAPELGVLAELGQIPFLPVAREAGSETPVRPGGGIGGNGPGASVPGEKGPDLFGL